ncbi:hypothetical protein OAQ84_00095 [Bdellovibrionales bacterium]|nr:hypothetical protein [Bdellovibrionales bacterium]
MNFLILTVAIASVFTLSACGGGGAPRLGGNACVKDHDPIPLKIDEKVAAKVSESFDDLPVGEYTYEGAEYVYKELTDLPYEESPKYTIIHLRDALQHNKKYKLVSECVSNVLNDTAISKERSQFQGVSKIKVDQSGNVNFSSKSFSFSLINNQFDEEKEVLPIQEKGSPDEFYESRDLQYGVYKHIQDPKNSKNPELYELRFRANVVGNKTASIYLAVKLRRADINDSPATDPATKKLERKVKNLEKTVNESQKAN